MSAKEKIVKITFNESIFRWDKEKEMSQKIKEIESEGWVFKEAKPVKVTKSILHLGGALNLYFTKD
jgi:hypothetical protein